MAMTQTLEWRGYRVITGSIKGLPSAQVYLGKVRATPEPFSGVTETAAIEAARAWIDKVKSARFEQRRAAHIATAEEYADYFTANPLRPHQRLMLAAHVEAEVLTVRSLAEAAGWDRDSTAALHYGKLARDLVSWLGLQFSERERDSLKICRRSLAVEAGRSDEGALLLRIHPELVEGLRLSDALAG